MIRIQHMPEAPCDGCNKINQVLKFSLDPGGENNIVTYMCAECLISIFFGGWGGDVRFSTVSSTPPPDDDEEIPF